MPKSLLKTKTTIIYKTKKKSEISPKFILCNNNLFLINSNKSLILTYPTTPLRIHLLSFSHFSIATRIHAKSDDLRPHAHFLFPLHANISNRSTIRTSIRKIRPCRSTKQTQLTHSEKNKPPLLTHRTYSRYSRL